MKKILHIIGLVAGFSGSASAQFWDFTEPEKLSGMVNSDAEESMPVFSEDSSTLYFVRTFDANNTGGENDQDIWFSRKDKQGNFGKSEKLKSLNNRLHNAVCGLNADGSRLYVHNTYDGNKEKHKGIASADHKNNGWQSPKSLDIPALNVQGDFVNFYVSKEEDIILLSFNGPGSLGAEDLYAIRKSAGGAWGEPVHMGNVLNTTGFEISPYLAGDTLFFSSDGHGGFGNADIFYTVRKDDTWTNWSEPVNLGPKINSAKFDAYLIYAGTQFYWSSNRGGEKSDIYHAASLMPPPLALAALAIPNYDQKAGYYSIDLTVEGGAGNLKYAWNNGDTVQDPVNLKPGTYKVTVTDAYGQTALTEVVIPEPPVIVPPLAIVEHVEEPVDPDPVVAEQKAKLKAIDEEINKDLNNNIIFFDENSSYFNAENRVVMNAIVPILKSKPELKIFIQSYCDKQGTTDYNIWLSEKRMTRVIDYLVANGIERSRISGNFKGESQPLVNCKNCSEQQHRLNRRTTIKFIPQ